MQILKLHIYFEMKLLEIRGNFSTLQQYNYLFLNGLSTPRLHYQILPFYDNPYGLCTIKTAFICICGTIFNIHVIIINYNELQKLCYNLDF